MWVPSTLPAAIRVPDVTLVISSATTVSLFNDGRVQAGCAELTANVRSTGTLLRRSLLLKWGMRESAPSATRLRGLRATTRSMRPAAALCFVLMVQDFIAHYLLNSSFDQEKPVTVKYAEHDPPDTTVLVFWLKTRQRGRWRDKVEPEAVVSNDALAELEAAGERARNYARR